MQKRKCHPRRARYFPVAGRPLLLFLILSVALQIAAQPDRRISVAFSQEDAVAALRHIETLADVKIQFNYEDVNFKVSLKSQAAAIDVVRQLIDGHGLQVQAKDNYLIISQQGKTPTVGRTVSGRVVDERGEPLIGATIMVEETQKGTVSNANGEYELTITASSGNVVVSYIGYQTQHISVARFAGMKRITMRPDRDRELDDVVVTGMTRMDRRLFTGATDKINAEDAIINGLADISRSLEGRSAGVSVQNVSGTFGTAPKIRVRGATSIYGSSKPLWVVDGVIMEDVTDISADDLSSGDAETLISSAIAGLNSDDIESFQILKDGSATSIYGARAMAGVIVVTTKRGHAGQSRISYTGEYTMRLTPSYATFNIMDSKEQMGIYRELRDKGWLNFAESYRASETGVYGKMYQLINTFDDVTGMFAIENTTDGMNNYLKTAEFRNTDWFSELFSNNIQHNHSVSVSSGNETLATYASLSAMVDPGWYQSSEVNRYTANLNTKYNISKHLSLCIITQGSYRKQKAPGTLSRSVDPLNGEVKRDFDINPYSFALNTSRTLDPDEFYTRNYADFNIKHELENNYMHLDVYDAKFQCELNWKPISGLELLALGAIRYMGTSQQHFILDNSNQAQAYRAMDDATIRDRNPWLYKDPDNPYALPISVLPYGGIYRKKEFKMRSYDFRTTANYSRTFHRDHFMNIFAGTELNDTQRTNDFFNGWGMEYEKGEIPFYNYWFLKQGLEQNVDYYSLSNRVTRMVAFFANATYAYCGRYVLNATYRYEGTNRLGRSRLSRWLPTWNVSGAWNVSEEPFFAPLQPILSHLTLKASYSLTGDPGPSTVSNASILIYNYKPYRPFGNTQESGLYIKNIANEELTYEKKHELNIGLDIGFLGNRINLATDWYRRNNFDLIGIAYTTGVGGEVSKLANVASMKSHGIEFTLSTKNIRSKQFSWETNFIFSHAENKITDYNQISRVVDVVTGSGFALQGYPVRSLFSFRFQGLTDQGLPTVINQEGTAVTKGADINFQSQNLDNLKYEGPTDPTTTGSLGNILKWKGFRLNLFITYSYGNVRRLDPVFSTSYSDITSMPREFKNRWVMAGDELVTHVPVILTARQVEGDVFYKTLYNAYNYSDVRVAKGDFIRMKEMSLAYQFPKAWLKPLHISDLSLKLQATNLFLIYADKKLNGQDPEFFRSGGVAAPVPKQLTMTLRVGM